jgi:hemoglobin-like flavoprotein
MTKRQIELVRESFEVIRGNSGPVAMLFYGRLFDLDPKLRQLFKTEMREQSRKLMDMLTSIVEHLDSLERVRPQLRELGNKHVGYGVRPEHYETVGSALLWAFGQALGREFQPEVRAAWLTAIHTISREMLSGADEDTSSRAKDT